MEKIEKGTLMALGFPHLMSEKVGDARFTAPPLVCKFKVVS